MSKKQNPKQLMKWFDDAPFKARHGDVVVVRDDNAPTDGKDAKGVVAEGEATGHAHRVSRAKAKIVVDNLLERTVIVARGVGLLSHEEHKTNPLPRGKYRTGIQKQESPEGWTRVQD